MMRVPHHDDMPVHTPTEEPLAAPGLVHRMRIDNDVASQGATMLTESDFAYVSAAELARRVREQELTSVELIDICIDRIEKRNPSLNAFVYKGFDDARKAAKDADEVVRSGAELGVLHGVPTAIKDLFDFKPGWPATFGGVRALKDFSLDSYCVFAERVEKAGAVIVGKTNSPVMGYRGACDNPLFGATRNPFDTSRNTGGSSGGSAAAVADGLVPFAEGTDGGGSIRIPAAWCGLYGYKASFGRVPSVVRPNAFGSTMPFLFEGPLTRTVEDAALVLNAISGHDPRDLFSLDDGPHDFTTDVGRDISGMRIAYTPDFGIFPVAASGRSSTGRCRSSETPAPSSKRSTSTSPTTSASSATCGADRSCWSTWAPSKTSRATAWTSWLITARTSRRDTYAGPTTSTACRWPSSTRTT